MCREIVSIVGTRPNFIKVAALSPKLENHFDHRICNTGQHYDYEMSQQFFEELRIPEPDCHLSSGSGSHAEQIASMMVGIERYLKYRNPDCVIVYGDCNTTLAGALVASKLNIMVAHVESGLRSYDWKMTEEKNRVLTDHMSNILFCPTHQAIINLVNEGFSCKMKNGRGVFMTGDVMYDLCKKYTGSREPNKKFMCENKDYGVVTIHRAENTEDRKRLEKIIYNISNLSNYLNIIFPIHPRTLKKMECCRKMLDKPKLKYSHPLGYVDMINLIRNAKIVITDSGGVQKEAYICKVPCITVRDSTEWPETVESGWNTLCEPDDIRYYYDLMTGNDYLKSINKNYDDRLFKTHRDSSSMIAEVLDDVI